MTDIVPCPPIQGGIVAAGPGARLPVGGRPLIELTLERFRAAGIRRLTVIINDTSNDCRQWLRDHTADFDLDLIVRTTPSSWASFQVVADRLLGGPAVITTIDAVL